VSNQEKNSKVFNEWANTERSEKMARGHIHLVDALIKNLKLKQDSTVLDLGCGTGDALMRIQKHFQLSKEKIYGIDQASEMVKKARRNCGGQIFVGDANKLSFENEFFDGLYTIESIYYHEDPQKSFSEAYRVLKQKSSFYCLLDFYAESSGTKNWPKAINLELKEYSILEWKNLLEKANFKNIQTSKVINPQAEELLNNFKSSEYFPNKIDYENHLKEGTLFIRANK